MTPEKMTTSKIILPERRSEKKKTPRFCFNRDLERALRAVGIIAVVAFVCVLSSAAFGANPAEELAKHGVTGGIDPKGNSWVSIQQSIEQFGHPDFIF